MQIMNEYEVGSLKVLIAGGGTAGHINPGVAIGKYIKQKQENAEILFVGTKRGMETKLIPREGFDLKFIRVMGFKRKFSVDTLISIKELLCGIIEARKILREYKPDIVIGTGGYVCGPVLFNASRMKIPTLIHEQNVYPGLTNKILARFVDIVAISFLESKKYFKSSKNVVYTGNPIRNEMLSVDKFSARKKIGIENDKPVVVIFGGSRGAEVVNIAVCDMLSKHFFKKERECNIIYATGENEYERICEKFKNRDLCGVSIVPYIYDMSSVMNSADLVICRAGAITISELTAIGVPSILIPSPYVTANHQEYNARVLEKHGAAVVVLEKELKSNILHNQMMSLLNDKDQLNKMARNSKKIGIINATEKIFSLIHDLTKL